MKNIFFTSVLCICSFFAFGQQGEIKIEKINEQTSKVTFHHDNGNVMHEGLYVNGKSEGLWSSFDENGKLKAKGEFKNGVKSGPWLMIQNNSINEIVYFENKIAKVNLLNKTAVASN